jgi:site-specific DNA-methyltransferase (cytosine-N4-specific)
LPKLKTAIASGFFSAKASPAKLAGNTIISLKTYGIIDDEANLSSFGKQLLASQSDLSAAHDLLAKRILVDLNGMAIVEKIREIAAAVMKIELKSLPGELGQRGIEASRNSSDLSGILGWLRVAKILNKYDVNEAKYAQLIGGPAEMLQALKGLTGEQIAFLRAMVALNITDWTPYNAICRHAEALYAGEIRFNWKDIVKLVLQPLQTAGLIEIRKKAKQAQETPEGRGGKATDVKPTGKFEKEIAEPLLTVLYDAAGYSEIRAIRSMSLEDIVRDMEGTDINKSGKALEILAIRLCQLLALDFMGWRETDEEVGGGRRVDAMLHSPLLVFPRWQVQCKSTATVSLDDVAKQVGLTEFLKSNVIVIVSTGEIMPQALAYAELMRGKLPINICCLSGGDLRDVSASPGGVVDLLSLQAPLALCRKKSFSHVIRNSEYGRSAVVTVDT